ncbi:MAG: PQQ-like beta-propeller repeat protein [Anaerolineales bacterium]|jgi:outer membrane protein assembly factor BamB
MNWKILTTLLSIIFIGITLSACSGRAGTATGWASVIADEENAYLAYNNHVYAINLTNGIERWHYPAEPDNNITFFAAPALTPDNQLIVGGYDNNLYSLDPTNAGLNWTFEESQNRYIAGPKVTENGIFSPSADKNLYAVDFNGERLWQPFETEQPLWSTPAVGNNCDCIYLPSMDHRVYAIDTSTGGMIWKTQDLGGAIVGTPEVSDDGVLYVGTFENEMLALDTLNGEIVWRFPTEDWVWAGPTLDGQHLYFGDLSGTFYALKRSSGELDWKIQPGGAIVGKPLVTEEGIYFTTEDGSIVSVSEDGTPRWNQTIEGNLHAGPVQANDLILVPTSQIQSLVIALDENGVQKWVFAQEQ